MYLNQRLDDQPVETRIRTDLSKTPRSRQQFQPVLQLQSIEAFGVHIHRRIISCHSAGKRPAVMLLAAEALTAGGVARSELLAALGARVRSRVRSTDLVVQIADSFGVYLDGDVASHTEAIHERLKLALLEEFGFGDVSLRIHPRFGVATHPGTAVSGVELVGAAALGIEG